MTPHDNDINQQRARKNSADNKKHASRVDCERCESGLMNFMTR